MTSLLRDVRYPALDGIRFYAAFIVFVQHVLSGILITHAGIPAERLSYTDSSVLNRILFFLTDGNNGVDLFFILSGFLMSRIVVSGSFDFGRFIVARVARIYPAFLASLVITAAADVWLFGWPWSAGSFAKNLLFLNAIPSTGTLPYNHVTWSLGYEFAFYLFIPALALLARFGSKRIAAAVLLAASIAYVPDTFRRVDALFVGALLGAFSDRDLRRIAEWLPLWLVLLVSALCAIGKAVYFATYLQYYYWYLPVAALTIVKIAWDDRNLANRFFRSTGMRWLGTLSYSIYLYHTAVASVVLLYFMPARMTALSLIWALVATSVITVAISYVSYLLLERPYFARRTKKTRSDVTA